MKKSVDIEFLWHLHKLVLPFPVNIITTVDKEGRVNAAPYSMVLPYSPSAEKPLILLICNRMRHTPQNIEATGEFVVNYPDRELCGAVVETSKYYPDGTDELKYSGLTPIAANKVKPPRIKECKQHMECVMKEVSYPSESQANFIARVVDISVDEEFYKLPREERVKRLNLPIYFGPTDDGSSIFGTAFEYRAIQTDLMPGSKE